MMKCSELPAKYQRGAAILVKNGFTKCVMPFGIIVVGHKSLSDAGILTTAKIVAELIDQDRNGTSEIYLFSNFS